MLQKHKAVKNIFIARKNRTLQDSPALKARLATAQLFALLFQEPPLYSTIFHSTRLLSFVEKLAPIFTMRFPPASYGFA